MHRTYPDRVRALRQLDRHIVQPSPSPFAVALAERERARVQQATAALAALSAALRPIAASLRRPA